MNQIKIFLNPKSECKEPRLKGFLQFIDDNTVTDTFSKRIKESVEKAKEDEEVKKSYMLMRDYVRDLYAEEFKEAEKKSKEEGKTERELEFAKQMLLEHELLDKIVKYTGLSKETITDLMKF